MNERKAGAQESRLAAWCSHHGYSMVASLGRLLHKPGATVLTVGVMALALALPLGLWLVLQNVQQLAGQVQESREVTLFLKLDVDAARAQALETTLAARSDVRHVQRETPQQALAQMRMREDLAAAIDALGEDAAQAALPTVLRLTPVADEQTLVRELQALPEVEQVQYDAQWRQRLQAWLAFGARVVQVLMVLLGLGALLVVGNTVRLDVLARREEIDVLQLLGASDGFVRRPFLYLGAWYGLLAGALALGVLAATRLALAPPLASLAQRYGSSFSLHGLPPLAAAAVLLGAGVLGWLGAGLVTAHHLRQLRPQESRDGR